MKNNYAARGQSLVEFVISFMLLIVLLLGTFEFGYAFFYWITIRDGAQEGATYASLHPDSSCQNHLEARVRHSSNTPTINLLDTAVTTITTTRAGTDIGDMITVEVNHVYSLHTPIIPDIIGSNTINLHAEVIVSVLQNDGTCQ
ncbi:MAG TPA: TadE family protein [Anaerolineales bacterium]|nr:TadE family protein [Anaerolineales bacterium]